MNIPNHPSRNSPNLPPNTNSGSAVPGNTSVPNPSTSNPQTPHPSQVSGQYATVSVRHKTRAERVAAHINSPGLLRRMLGIFGDVENRKHILLVMLVALLMCIATQAWDPPIGYQEHDVPDRDIVCCVPFVVSEPVVVNPLKKTWPRVRYRNSDSVPSLATVALQTQPAVPKTLPEPEKSTLPNVGTVDQPVTLPEIGGAIDNERSHDSEKPENDAKDAVKTDHDGALEQTASPVTETSSSGTQPSSNESQSGGSDQQEATVPKAPTAKTPASQKSEKPLKEPVPILDNNPGQAFALSDDLEIREFEPGIVLVKAGQPVTRHEYTVLQAEYLKILAQRSFLVRISRFLGVYSLTLALFLLAFVFLHRRERRKPRTTLKTVVFYSFMVVTVIVSTLLRNISSHGANLELVPVLLLAQNIAIAFSWELALITTVIISFVLALSQTNTFFPMILLVGVTASVVIHLGRLRSRTKLVMIGTFGAAVAFFLTLAAKVVEGQVISGIILEQAVLNAFWTCVTSFLMTGLLPFIERFGGILTDMSFLDLGDASHPLLHELIRRAPATHSHSIQVAAIAETAAEAIGARGHLVRVGAYFHDIGKIINPDFFTENQVPGQNVHDTLEPRMSTLVIVSHVKDGVDLARQHRIPQPIIDLIEQHHGTSLVSFFHALAVKQSREQGYSHPIDEGSFRYPGPRPQSKEAGILMLADAAESACRSLRDASPNKIEAMVRQIAENKLKDSQFDESGLTLRELRIIENSIINSILATRHCRISYPDAIKSLSSDSKTKPADSGILEKHKSQ